MVSPALAVPIQREVGEKRRTRSGNQVADQLRSERSISHSSIAVLAAVLPRQPLGDQRSGNAAADDQRVASGIFSDARKKIGRCALEPRRAAAAEIGLFGVILVERTDVSPQTATWSGSLTASRAASATSRPRQTCSNERADRHGRPMTQG